MEHRWPQLYQDLQSSTKERLQGVEELQALLQQNFSLSREQLHELLDVAGELLTDNNFKVAQGMLVVLNTLIQNDSEQMKPYVHILIPSVVERLGDARQSVRQEACGTLLTMLGMLPVQLILEKMSRFWSHRAWKVRHGLLQTVAEAVSMQTPGLLSGFDQRTHIITCAVNLLEDKNDTVREAAQDCLEELYRALGQTLVDSLQQQCIRPAVLRDLIARLDAVAPTHMGVPETSSTGASRGNNDAMDNGVTSVAQRPAPRKKAAPAGAVNSATTSQSAEEPSIVPAVVQSEKELISELSAMATPLSGTTVDWQQRMALMQRLQSLAIGCPPHMHDVLVDALKPLRDPLTKQVEDRRSAISKQACQLLSTLSSVLGLRFSDMLIQYLPVLAKVLPITVQVMAEAADACCVSLLANCPSPRAVTWLAQAVAKDKSAKVRACCGSYLAHALQTWDPSGLVRCCEDIETAMRLACQDANADARAASRKLYAAYCSALPEAAQQFTAKLPPSLLDKLSKPAGVTSRPASAAPRPGIRRPASASNLSSMANKDPDIIVLAPAARPSSATGIMPSTTTATASNHANNTSATVSRHAGSAQPATRVVASTSTMNEVPPLPDKRPSNSRKSMAAPGRVLYEAVATPGPAGASCITTTAAVDANVSKAGGATAASVNKARRASSGTAIQGNANSTTAAAAPVRIPATPQPISLNHTSHTSASHTFHTTHAPQRLPVQSVGSPNSRHHHYAVSSDGSCCSEQQTNQSSRQASMSGSAKMNGMEDGYSRSQSISTIATALLSGHKAWNEKVELLTILSEQVRGACCGTSAGIPAEVMMALERLPVRLLECVDDGHAKVSAAALTLLADCVTLCSRVLEAYVDRMLPCLFGRQHDSKDAVRVAACKVLHEVSTHYTADLILPGLMRALEAHKQPRVKQAILEYGAAHIGAGRPAGCPNPNTTLLRQWMRAVGCLMTDKSPDVRKAVCDALQAIQERIDAAALAAYVRHASGAEALALKRFLSELERNSSNANTDVHTLHDTHGLTTMLVPTSVDGGSNGSVISGSRYQPDSTAYTTAQAFTAGNGYASSEALNNGSTGISPGLKGSTTYTVQHYMSPDKAAAPSLQVNNISDPGSAHHHSNGSSSTSELISAGHNGAWQRNTSIHTLSQPMRPGMITTNSMSSAGTLVASQSITDLVRTLPVKPALPAALPVPSMAQSQTQVSSISTSAMSQPPIVVPADAAGQMRVMHLLLLRMGSGSASEALRDFEEKCLPVVLPGAWTAVAPQLFTSIVRHILVHDQPQVRVSGLRLVRCLAVQQPQLMMSPQTVNELLPAILLCAASSTSLVTKTAMEAVDAILDVVPLPTALASLTSQLQAACPAGGMKLHSLCNGLQRAMARLSSEQAATHLPPTLLPLLRTCADDDLLEVRKSAIYALAQMRAALGDSRFAECHESQLTPCQLQLVAWAHTKIRAASSVQQSA